MSASSECSVVTRNDRNKQKQEQEPMPLNPDEVFDRLLDMFGMTADASVILEIGERASWKLDECIEKMIQFTNDQTNAVTVAAEHNMRNLNLNQIATAHHEENYCETANDCIVDAPPPTQFQHEQSTPTSIQEIFSLAANGAIPKSHRPTNHFTGGVPNQFTMPPPPVPMSLLLKHGSQQFTDASSAQSKHLKLSPTIQPPEVADIVSHIAQGHRIMVLMRGAPGSGKSFLARSLLHQAMPDALANVHICSADDLFTAPNGQYNFDPSRLPEAHAHCQARVRSLAQDNWSPIFVDNTNIQFWQMQPYFCIALQHNYLIRTIEPATAWRTSAGQLARKNVHGVPKKSIETMLNNFEPVVVEQVLRTAPIAYTAPLPQMRQYPQYRPVQTAPLRITKNTESDPKSPKPPPNNHTHENRDIPHQKTTPRKSKPKAVVVDQALLDVPDPSDTFQIAAQKLQSVNNEWTAFEKERIDFWTTGSPNGGTPLNAAHQTPTSQCAIAPPNMVSLLRDDSSSNQSVVKQSAERAPPVLNKHRAGCTNENQLFFQIRQIYPNVPDAYLWDLFKNCDGDADWTMDILLKEETCVDQFKGQPFAGELTCGCDGSGEHKDTLPLPSESVTRPPTTPSRQKKRDRYLANQNNQVLRQIEASIVIDDIHYSEHSRKIRDIRRGVSESTSQQASTDQSDETDEADVPFSSDALATSDDTSETDSDEYMEINLGHKVIAQLEALFGTHTIPVDATVDKEQLSTNVFMPKVLGQQLYALWMESMYNQIEEQRLKTLRADEEFARNLQVQQSASASVPTVAKPKLHIKDVVEMECAWAEYNAQLPGDDWKGATDLASKITQQNLNEKFPNIEADTLRDVLVANNNRFAETVEMLNRMMPAGIEDDANIAKTTEELLLRAKAESDKVTQAHENGTMIQAPSKLTDPTEAKRQALSSFEECRNKAMHHTQMKAECYYKAKNSIQRGDTAVAVYYSRVANLHRTRIEHYNHMASNCIMEVHNQTQTNPDILDLHYLYLTEAIECLDLFVDEHINRMRSAPQPYKNLLVITGRGLHSSGGFSTIKQHTKIRLKKRGLSWFEVNPGLLRFKIFCNSPMSMDV